MQLKCDQLYFHNGPKNISVKQFYQNRIVRLLGISMKICTSLPCTVFDQIDQSIDIEHKHKILIEFRIRFSATAAAAADTYWNQNNKNENCNNNSRKWKINTHWNRSLVCAYSVIYIDTTTSRRTARDWYWLSIQNAVLEDNLTKERRRKTWKKK